MLTNPVMPGIVKIGMTDRPDVRHRMGDLYTTGVPLPFDCVIAREIENRTAAEVESALHTAFGPNRVNPSREFFEVEPEQVAAVLRLMQGRDVTPGDAGQSTDLQPDDREVSAEFKRRRSRTNELEFLESLNDNGTVVYERVLALGKQDRMRIRWGLKGFSLNVVSNEALAAVCQGYPPSAYNQNIYTDFDSLLRKSSIPQAVVDELRTDALDSGLFAPVGIRSNLVCQTDRSWDEASLSELIGWMNSVVERVLEFESSKGTEVAG